MNQCFHVSDCFRNGIFPLTAFALTQPPHGRVRPNTPEVAESVKSESPEPTDTETRMVVSATCQVKKGEEAPSMQVLDSHQCLIINLSDDPFEARSSLKTVELFIFQLTIHLRMDDRMNRQLSCEFTDADTAPGLADELVHYGFINPVMRFKIIINLVLCKYLYA